ncbi:glycosyltransferase family 4 protein [Algoriphagus sp. D3-2-R+10]|uniref:glycosyltransferase family 4 protein n=1 Tax=Algoriphagus aurantiacus TaxID=3103948 RepID=UPI002B380E00|nr:glycosyltransferase family 4 protein [Algoriphagus sp. D3-2-R+10]MEB2777527.1 glycosyltransferase family 4 protein [Algoriphagus sp. D3-2-R+10]
MKILYFYQYFATSKGSWGTRIHEFTREWVKKGHHVTVVTSVYSKSDVLASKFIDTQYFDGVKVIIINVRIDNRQPFLKRIFSFLTYSLLSCWYALTYPAQVVIASSGPITVGIPGLIAKLIRGRKLVFESRDLWPDGAIELGIIKNSVMIKAARWFEKLCYRSSDLIVALSIGMEKEIMAKSPDRNVITVTNAANITLFSTPRPFPAKLGIRPKTYAIYTGNIGEVNNSLWLLEAAKVLQKKGSSLKILMIGEGQQRELIDQQIKDHKLESLLRWPLMPKENLVFLVQHALVSLVPLKGTPVLDTSSPNKFFESLSAGVPVVQNTQGWMKDFLVEHQVGFTLPPNDPEALADLLISLALDPEHLAGMKDRALKISSIEFDKNRLAERMITAIESIVI